MSFICYAGGSKHMHEKASDGRACYASNGPVPLESAAEVASHYVDMRKSTFGSRRVSSQIRELTALEAEVPGGYYAVVDPDDNRLKFYRVDKGTGRWEGYTFLKVQASDDWYRCKARDYRLRILLEIAKDPDAASKRYATELGRCRKCNRTLTDHDNNPYFDEGYGPECGAKI